VVDVQDDRSRNRDEARPGGRPDDEAGDLAVDVAEELGARVLRMSGELDFAVAPGLLPRVAELVAGASGVVLDLTAVTFFDSSGVRLVDRLARECGRDDVPFSVVARPGTATARVLDIVGFGPPLVVPDLAAGLAAVRDRD
jgi:anti-sigma B factor antagonist